MATPSPSVVPVRRSGPVDWDLVAWIVVGLIVVACFALRKDVAWVAKFPESWILPLGEWVQVLMNWFVENFRWLFKSVSWLLEWPLEWIVGLLQWLPWPATAAVFVILAYVSAGWRLALFTAFALFYMLLIGFWLGEHAHPRAGLRLRADLTRDRAVRRHRGRSSSPRFNRVVQPSLDLMQTFPTFAYLLPIMLLFGFGRGGRSDCERDLRQPPDGEERHSGPAAGADRGRGVGLDVGHDQTPAPVVGAGADRPMSNIMMGVNQTHDGGAQHGHHRRLHRRLRRHRLGSAADHP